YVWVGIFSLAMIAQFWSLANDMYPEEAGKRLFPVIAIGAVAGASLGSKIAALLFDAGVSPYSMMQITVGILMLHLVLTLAAERRGNVASGKTEAKQQDDALKGSNGFALVLRSSYIRLIALVMVLLNLVNTTGEYILSKTVVQAADAAIALDATVDKGAFIGSFYGDFFFYVNIVTLLIQAFAVSRIVKYLGIKGVLFALPLVAFGAYGVIAFGAALGLIRVLKTAENSTDYSVMNTAKALIWLPTSRAEKYKAKQAVDTFFVRTGDLLSGGLVFVGTVLFQFGIKQFAIANLFLIALWVFITYLLWKEYRRISET
ncbi:MAG: translocase, partial [Candidatus Latescibacteria bacterium]|nr:translocase [Candidatus Latescibacterota bacterium]